MSTATTSTTQTMNVTLSDDFGNDSTFKIDNPKMKDGTEGPDFTKAQVASVCSALFSSENQSHAAIMYNHKGNPITQFKDVVVEYITKTTVTVDE